MSQYRQINTHWSKQPKPQDFETIPDDETPEDKPTDLAIYPGYETLTSFGKDQILEPPPPPAKRSGEAPTTQIKGSVTVNAEACRAALMDMVSHQRCWGSKAAKNMVISNVLPSTGLHYVLETFSERRTLHYASECYKGYDLDDSKHGRAPLPWDIAVEPDSLFKDQTKQVPVPHTETVRACWRCDRRGWQRCSRCQGYGYIKCARCHGKGKVHKRRTTSDGLTTEVEKCKSCTGKGSKKCGRCGGDGRVACVRCFGHARVKCFLEISVKFNNHKSEYIFEATDLPDELVKHVNGIVLFQQTLPQVWPITAYHVEDLNTNSMRLVEEHRTRFPTERQIQQRHTLRAVPVTEAHYTWNGNDMRFWVYGLQKSVYHPDYPQQHCCGCTLM